MSIENQTLIVRALNNTRNSYFPTYAGLRLLGDQLGDEKGHFLANMIERRLKSGENWRFRRFQLYKGTKGGLNHEYRECLTSSPLTALAEAHILYKLSQQPSMAGHSNLYSYRWPKSGKSGTSYQFFAQGYKERNVEIALALAKPGAVAVVTDIKSFYPGVEHEKVQQLLEFVLSQPSSLSPEITQGILHFYSQLLSASPAGIPVGPACGHLLGNLVLAKVDQQLSQKFGNHYFRYVDDIVVVCDKSDVSSTESAIFRAIEAENLKINKDKTAHLDSQQWHHYVSRPDIEGHENFWDLTRDLALYLAVHPGKAKSLHDAFIKEGLSVPIKRILSISSCNRFRFLLRANLKANLNHKITVALSSEGRIVSRATLIKEKYKNSLDDLLSAPIEKDPTLRRWQVQRIRRLVNSMFYLQSFGEWNQPHQFFERAPELVEQAALATALSTGKIDPILPFFGRGPAAFSELWLEHGEGAPIMEDIIKITDTPKLDSLITLRLHGLAPEQFNEFENLGGNERLFTACGPAPRNLRTIPDLSYEDEFESLRLGKSSQEIQDLLKNRYSPKESAPLEAFSLSSSEYRS